MITCHYLISGHVQRVGFRYFTQDVALQSSLVGWVRNLTDGRVEVLAMGLPEEVSKFEAAISKGPRNAFVKEIVREQIEGCLSESSFRILPDEELIWQKP